MMDIFHRPQSGTAGAPYTLNRPPRVAASFNKIGAANVRPAPPLQVLRDFGRGFCAPPFRSAHVADLCR